jgi:hypothetical protein
VEGKYFPIIQRVGTSYVCRKSVALLSFFDYNLQESGNGVLRAFNIIHTKLKAVFFFDAFAARRLARAYGKKTLT